MLYLAYHFLVVAIPQELDSHIPTAFHVSALLLRYGSRGFFRSIGVSSITEHTVHTFISIASLHESATRYRSNYSASTSCRLILNMLATSSRRCRFSAKQETGINFITTSRNWRSIEIALDIYKLSQLSIHKSRRYSTYGRSNVQFHGNHGKGRKHRCQAPVPLLQPQGPFFRVAFTSETCTDTDTLLADPPGYQEAYIFSLMAKAIH